MNHDPHMPGAWICPQCGFTLQKNILNATDGETYADTSPLNEICPNDRTLMRPLTWREVNHNLFEQVLEYAPIVRAADALEDYMSLIGRFHVVDWDALAKLNNELRDALKPYRRTNNAFAKAVAENLPKP